MKTLIALFFAACPLFLWADPWENLTLEEANQVTTYLQENPYILDYCDCCQDGKDSDTYVLSKVISSKIVPCEWDAGSYSVAVETEFLATMNVKGEVISLEKQGGDDSENTQLISMNYTWGYNKEKKKAAPLYSSVPYAYFFKYNDREKLNSGICSALFSFPTPKAIKNKEYKKWYKKN